MYKVFSLFMAAFLPGVAGAQGIAQSSDAGPFQDLLINILDFSNDVLIPFIIGIGFLFFVWGIFKFFIFGGANEEAKEQGKSLIIWATIGFVLIIVFWGVVNLLSESTGLANGELQNIPTIDVP
ncbi:MAG: uncharacterized membrane protein YidH (DUF202 family) [Candidatus Paceibacteria bacterium]|jgi:uncharacterized membrane protein YidH (DUF202 family)